MLQLDVVKRNQFALFEKISETNHYLAEIAENTQQTADRMKLQNIQTADLEIQIRELQRQSKIGNYCAEQTRREIERRNRIESLR